MFINPKKIKFDLITDPVDFVSRGITPSKKQYNAFRDMLPANNGGPVSIAEDIGLSEEQRYLLGIVLDRIYDNNMRKRKQRLVILGVAALGVAGLFAATIAKCNDHIALIEAEYGQRLKEKDADIELLCTELEASGYLKS